MRLDQRFFLTAINDNDVYLGFANMDNIPSRSCTFQDPARGIPKNWIGMGDPR